MPELRLNHIAFIFLNCSLYLFMAECGPRYGHINALKLWPPAQTSPETSSQWEAPDVAPCRLSCCGRHCAWLETQAAEWHNGAHLNGLLCCKNKNIHTKNFRSLSLKVFLHRYPKIASIFTFKLYQETTVCRTNITKSSLRPLERHKTWKKSSYNSRTRVYLVIISPTTQLSPTLLGRGSFRPGPHQKKNNFHYFLPHFLLWD